MWVIGKSKAITQPEFLFRFLVQISVIFTEWPCFCWSLGWVQGNLNLCQLISTVFYPYSSWETDMDNSVLISNFAVTGTQAERTLYFQEKKSSSVFWKRNKIFRIWWFEGLRLGLGFLVRLKYPLHSLWMYETKGKGLAKRLTSDVPKRRLISFEENAFHSNSSLDASHVQKLENYHGASRKLKILWNFGNRETRGDTPEGLVIKTVNRYICGGPVYRIPLRH